MPVSLVPAAFIRRVEFIHIFIQIIFILAPVAGLGLIRRIAIIYDDFLATSLDVHETETTTLVLIREIIVVIFITFLTSILRTVFKTSFEFLCLDTLVFLDKIDFIVVEGTGVRGSFDLMVSPTILNIPLDTSSVVIHIIPIFTHLTD